MTKSQIPLRIVKRMKVQGTKNHDYRNNQQN
jgi:hypothetical protein